MEPGQPAGDGRSGGDTATRLSLPLFTIECAPPFLTARFFKAQRTLGWSVLHPAFATVREVVWIEVRWAEIDGVDIVAFTKARLAALGQPYALAFLTSRDIERHHRKRRLVDGVAATCLTTVGLSNGERIGSRRQAKATPGTINTLVHVSRSLTDGALVEAVSIVAEARTAAILEARSARAAPAITGTGTDCIVVACPLEGEPTPWAGLHTAVGEAIGGAVYEATREGVEVWDRETSDKNDTPVK